MQVDVRFQQVGRGYGQMSRRNVEFVVDTKSVQRQNFIEIQGCRTSEEYNTMRLCCVVRFYPRSPNITGVVLCSHMVEVECQEVVGVCVVQVQARVRDILGFIPNLVKSVKCVTFSVGRGVCLH